MTLRFVKLVSYEHLNDSQKMCITYARMDGEKAIFFAKCTPAFFTPFDCDLISRIFSQSAASHIFRCFPELRD
jgi:hypothetical protein